MAKQPGYTVLGLGAKEEYRDGSERGDQGGGSGKLRPGREERGGAENGG
jgi:hypothetical protein